ncbi:MAG: hypothetical protein ACREXM_15175 [Gammaproteobacteria bacterium]
MADPKQEEAAAAAMACSCCSSSRLAGWRSTNGSLICERGELREQAVAYGLGGAPVPSEMKKDGAPHGDYHRSVRETDRTREILSPANELVKTLLQKITQRNR